MKTLLAAWVAARDALSAHQAAHRDLPRSPRSLFTSVDDERKSGEMFHRVALAERALLTHARSNRDELQVTRPSSPDLAVARDTLDRVIATAQSERCATRPPR